MNVGVPEDGVKVRVAPVGIPETLTEALGSARGGEVGDHQHMQGINGVRAIRKQWSPLISRAELPQSLSNCGRN